MLRIRFGNGLILGGDDYHLQAPIQGLDTPAIRNGNAVYTGADGGYMISQYYGHRTIVLRGFFIGPCHSRTDELRKGLLNKLLMRYYSSIVIEDLDNNFWFTQGYITDVKCDITSPRVGEYQISILCPDPLIYPANSLTAEEPVKITTNLVRNGEKTVLRQGDCDAYPVITLTGKFTNPTIQIGDLVFSLNSTTTASSVITIDMKNRTVRNELGHSLASLRTTNSQWLYLAQGANTVALTTTSNADTGTATMVYSAGYRGI